MINKRDLVVSAIAVILTLGAVARRDFFDSPVATLDRLECHVTTINPGEAPHPPHQHPEEELIV